jgi:hypothetical protein
MRRALASVLLVLISSQLLTPLLPATTRSDLPACCRRDGKHHCVTDAAAGSPRTLSTPKCELFPQAALVAARSKVSVVASGRGTALIDFFSFRLAEPADSRPRNASLRSAYKRGPPPIL